MKEVPKLGITIFSDPQYDQVVAEIYYDEKFVCLISQDEGPENLRITFPADLDTSVVARSVELDWFLDAVQKAKGRLLNGGSPKK